MLPVMGLDRKVSNYEAARDDKFWIESGVGSLDPPVAKQMRDGKVASTIILTH